MCIVARVTQKSVVARTFPNEDIDIAFATIARDNIDALFILGQPLIGAQRVRVAKLALDHRMPAISVFDIATEAGLLTSYGGRLIR